MGQTIEPEARWSARVPWVGRADPSGRTPIRVVLADDHWLVRAGIRTLLADLAGIEVVGEASNADEAVRLVRDRRPDVALLDIAMPAHDGLEALARLREAHPSVRVMILSMHDDEEHVWQALHGGASGYLLKDSSIEELDLAIRAVAHGGTYVTPGVSHHVFAANPGRLPTEEARPVRLSPRQRSVARLVALGHSNRETAHTLGLSAKTVAGHRAKLMARLGVRQVAGIVRYAVRAGLVTSDE